MPREQQNVASPSRTRPLSGTHPTQDRPNHQKPVSDKASCPHNLDVFAGRNLLRRWRNLGVSATW